MSTNAFVVSSPSVAPNVVNVVVGVVRPALSKQQHQIEKGRDREREKMRERESKTERDGECERERMFPACVLLLACS